MKKIKNISAIIVVAGAATLLPINALAVPGGNVLKRSFSKSITQPIVVAIESLGQQMQALSSASVKMTNNMLNQIDSFFPSTAPGGSDGSIDKSVQKSTNAETQSQITDGLMQFPLSIASSSSKMSSEVKDAINTSQGLVKSLTQDVPASDTYYASEIDSLMSGTSSAAKPEDVHDDYFNFDALLGPNAYSTDQQSAAEHYIDYAAQTYKTYTGDLDISDLKSLLGQKSATDRASWIQANLIENRSFQDYQLAIRSALAERSLALSNLNYLYTQRVAVKDLGDENGLPQDANLPDGYASPLQVQDNVANSLINNPEWYKKMKTASPITLQREQLLLTATLVRQQQQQKEYSARLLAAISMMSLDINTLNIDASLKDKAQAVNKIINPNGSSLPAGATQN
jgi:intracellular multiplication protein IcmX